MLGLALVGLLGTAHGWYLPGMAPTDYNEGDSVPIFVNRLTSSDQSGTAVGLDYYSSHFKHCEPEGGKKSKGGSLGSILFGDRIYTSPMSVSMLRDEDCHVVCTAEYKSRDVEFVANKIARQYMQHWLIDGLPITGVTEDGTEESDTGFYLGTEFETEENVKTSVLYNHYDIVVDYHYNQNAKKYRVVGASILPRSIGPQEDGDEYSCAKSDANNVLKLNPDTVEESKVTYSFSVKWRSSETPWATRWDHYLKVKEPVVNWFALINTTVLVFVLCLFCGLVLTRMLRKDIAQYNSLDLSSEDIPDEVGWKLVAGDVFRPPPNVQLYAIAIGTGAQLLVTFLVTLTLAALGFLSPANRGSFTTALLLLNTILGGVGGYFSAVAYKTWGGSLWKTNLLLTPVVLPCLMFVHFFITNLLLVINDASGAVPAGSMFVLILIWGVISVPLSFVTGFVGFKKPVPFPPKIRVNQIPRQIPPQPWYLKTVPLLLISGIIPYLAVSIQLRYILSAIWFQSIYYMFGFLFTSVWAMVLLSLASCLLALYFTLGNEDYCWQWRSFMVAGSPAIYIYIHSCYYLLFNMSLKSFTGSLVYLGYTSLLSLLIFLGLGSIGAVCSYLLVRKIYESIKMD